MSTLRTQYAYFERLEKTVKIALTIYLTVCLIGIAFTLFGIDHLLQILQGAQWVFKILIGLSAVSLFGILFYSIGKVSWLGELHTRLDKLFFGFLKKSNEGIFHSLIIALEPYDQQSAIRLDDQKRNFLAESIFSRIAHNEHLFETMLTSEIFRRWIWYWIVLYGTFVFTLLTVISFLVNIVDAESLTKLTFTINWTLALLHLGISLIIGYSLVHMAKRTVENIVQTHRHEIATILKENIYGIPVVVS